MMSHLKGPLGSFIRRKNMYTFSLQNISKIHGIQFQMAPKGTIAKEVSCFKGA